MRILLLALLCESVASAQPPPDQPVTWVLGGAMGFGDMVQFDGGDLVGIGGNLHALYFVLPNLAVGVDGDAVNHPYGSTSQLVQGEVGGALHWYPHPKIWLKAGLGAGWWKLTEDMASTHCDWLFGCSTDHSMRVTTSEIAPALSLGAGIDVYAARWYAISAQVVSTTFFYGDGTTSNLAVMLGFDFLIRR